MRTAVKPRLLDAYCGAGGTTRGYQLAGFHVTGIDIHPQPNYIGDAFIQADALEYLAGDLSTFTAIHCSPPCQAFTHAKHMANRGRKDHPRLIEPTRRLLIATGLPYVIENVEDAKSELLNPAMLCGSSVGLVNLERHRYFETNWPLLVPPCSHGQRGKACFPGTPRADGTRPLSTIVNQMASGITHDVLAEAMGIDWMPTRGKRPSRELCEAIPPAYTELIGHQLAQHLRSRAAA